MIRCPLSSPACDGHGGSWRSGSPATGLPSAADATRCSGSVTHCDRGQRYCSVACRPQARLQQRRCANCRHQRSPEGRLDHRDRQREYRRAPGASARDGSRFPFDHFSGIIRMWDGRAARRGYTPDAAPGPKQPVRAAVLPASAAGAAVSSIRFHAFHDEGEQSMISPETRVADSPLFLCRALEGRHHRP